MIKRFIIMLVLLAVVVGGVVGFNMFRDNAIQDFFANMPVQTMTVSTVEAEPSTWQPSVDAIGTVNAVRGVDLTVETMGIVGEVLFTANRDVNAGDLLLRLDDAVQTADLEAGKTTAALDQQTLQRVRELQSRGVGSASALEAAEAAASTSRAQVARLEAVLAQKTLIAPFSGTIGIPRVDTGQYVQPGTIVATLQDLETMRVDFTVPEQELGKLSIGQSVSVRAVTSSRRLEGRITGIDPKVDPQSRLVSVRAEIDNPDGELTPGQFVSVRVNLPTEDDVIVLPQTAVVTSLYGDYVYIVRPREQAEGEAAPVDAEGQPVVEARQIFVQVGRRVDGLVEIAEGVSPGDQVVTAGQNRLSNGTPVKVDNSVTPGNPAGGPASGQAGDAEDATR